MSGSSSEEEQEMAALTAMCAASIKHCLGDSSEHRRDQGVRRPGQGGPGVSRGVGVKKRKFFENEEGQKAIRWRDADNPSPWERMFLDVAHGGKAAVIEPGSLRYDTFRRKFRVPLEEFHKILDEIRASDHPSFKDEMKDATGNPHPLGLKLLAALRVIGSGTAFEAQEEGSGIREDTIRTFFLAWCKWMHETKKDHYISFPKTTQEIHYHERVYSMLGLPGAWGSMDAVHWWAENVPARFRSLFKGKETYSTIVFNVVCGHNTWIMNVHGWFPGAKNDKSLVRDDDAVIATRTADEFVNYRFNLLGPDGETIVCRGAWLICDGGYHKWLATMCGFKDPTELARAWTER